MAGGKGHAEKGRNPNNVINCYLSLSAYVPSTDLSFYYILHLVSMGEYNVSPILQMRKLRQENFS